MREPPAQWPPQEQAPPQAQPPPVVAADGVAKSSAVNSVFPAAKLETWTLECSPLHVGQVCTWSRFSNEVSTSKVSLQSSQRYS